MALLTQQQGITAISWITLVGSMQETDPDRLQTIIDTYLPSNDQDISTLTLREITVLFIEAIDNCELEEGTIEPFIEMIELSSSFPQTQPEYLASVSALYINVPENRTDCGCDTDAYITNSSLSSAEFIACMSECMDYDPNAGYCMDSSAANYLGALPCQNGSTPFGETFVGGLIGDLWTATTENLGTILGAFLGNSDTDTTPGGGGGGGDDDDDNDDDTAIDWGKIAIWGGVVIAVGLVGYFVYKRNK